MKAYTTAANSPIMAAIAGTFLLLRFNSPNMQGHINVNASPTTKAQDFLPGKYYLLERSLSNRSDIFEDGVSIANGATASTGIPNENINIGATPGIAFLNGTLSTFLLGGTGFDHVGHNTNIVTLLTSLGVLP